MQEANIQKVVELKENKDRIINMLKRENPYLLLKNGDMSVSIRVGVVKEMLNKELAYTDKMLKSFGVKELS